MKPKDRRGYRKDGPGLTNVVFSSDAERAYVKKRIRDISLKVANERRAQGISQERLAELANVSVSTIKFIEQNQRAPSLPLLMKLVYLLDKKAALWT